MNRLLLFLGKTVVALFLLLLAYAGYWGLWARIPREPTKFIDMRRSIEDRPHYVVFCASLASNAYGFPGHAYVIWSANPTLNQQAISAADNDLMQSGGYVPRFARDQIPSLFQAVPGLMVHDARRGNCRNLDRLIVAVDPDTYARTLKLRDSWSTSEFRVGVRDCVAFADSIAQEIGLTRPPRNFVYPQEYVAELKMLNPGSPVSARMLASFPR